MSIIKFHIKFALCSGVVGTIFRLDYDKNRSFGRNCLNGFRAGFFLGWTWPMVPLVAPMIAYGYIENYIDSSADIERLLDVANPDPDRPTWLDVSLAEKTRMGGLKTTIESRTGPGPTNE
jgi:hypothetical protein